MNASIIRRKLSIAFTVYNRSRAEARIHGDTKKLEALNKTLGRLVKDAYRCTRFFRLPGSTRVLFQNKNVSAKNRYSCYLLNGLGHETQFTQVVIYDRAVTNCPATFLSDEVCCRAI
jgi:hypothetical protein